MSMLDMFASNRGISGREKPSLCTCQMYYYPHQRPKMHVALANQCQFSVQLRSLSTVLKKSCQQLRSILWQYEEKLCFKTNSSKEHVTKEN
jgi:hypothetical protein